MRLTPAPPIADVHPESPQFRTAASQACAILAGTKKGIIARHFHPEIEIKPGEVVFVKSVSPEELSLYPLPIEEAALQGLPSCWGVTPDRKTVELWYADQQLHEASDVDVTSTEFLESLAEAAEAFADRRLHQVVEITIGSRLYPPGEGRVTYEETFEDGSQTITFIDTPKGVLAGVWANVACLVPGPSGEPVVVGLCGISTCEEHKQPM